MSACRLGRVGGLALLIAVVAGACAANEGAVTGDDPLVVAAASDLRPAFAELGEGFEARTGAPVTFSFGSSGQLAQQIIEGAPMDVYASADVGFVERVLESGRGDPASQTTYAFGRLALWSRDARWGGWDTLSELADDPAVARVAIANPEHAPYGVAARQALESARVWQELQPRLVYAENIADAQRIAATGDADVALVALSLALAGDERGDGAWTLVSPDEHEPLQQDLVVIADDAERQAVAAQFIEHVMSDEGRAVMERYGFAVDVDAAAEPEGG